jgi:hypothetical protein
MKEDFIQMSKKLKLTKKKAEQFCKALCGTTKGLNLGYSDIWTISPGHMRYDFWILDSRIYVQVMVVNHCISSYFFDFETLEPDFEYTDAMRDKDRQDIINQDRLEFMLWLRDDSKYKVNIPDSLIEKYESLN